jgi:hypothetical protein
VPKSTLTLLTRNYEALVLWAKAYDIVNGGLDQVLTSSRLIRRSYLKSLVSVSCTLLERLLPLYPVLVPLEATIPLRETLHRDGFKCLEDTYRDDDSVDISPSYSEDSIEDIVKDLEVDVDCLLDMDPLFSCPAADRKEPLNELPIEQFLKSPETSVIDLKNAQPTKQPKTVEFNEDVDPGSERVREQLLDQMERLARGIQESHLDPRDSKPLTEGLDKLQRHITSTSFKSDDLAPAAKGLSTLGEALMASIKERDEKLQNMKKKEGKRKEQIEEVDSDLEIVSWRTIKPESPHTYDLDDLTARLEHLSSLIAEFKSARERLSEYERRVAEHGLEAGALADIIAEYSAFQAEQRLKGWRLQVGDNVAVRRRLEKILKKAREETERLLLHVPSASSAQKDVPSNDDNIDLKASRQRPAGDGDHANSSDSDGGPAKGLDKKFECPEKGCGKSYSRAEHLYASHIPCHGFPCR